MTFDAEMEQTLLALAEIGWPNASYRFHHKEWVAISALLADWKQQRELIAIQYRVNEDMTKVVQEAEAERDRLREENERLRVQYKGCDEERISAQNRANAHWAENWQLTSKNTDLEATIDRADEHTKMLMQKIETAERVIKRLNALASQALELHRPVHNGYERFCSECSDAAWPCPTVKAIRGE